MSSPTLMLPGCASGCSRSGYRPVAADLIARYPSQRLHEAVAVAAAQPARNTAGWIVTALRDGWDLTDRLAELDAGQARRRRGHDAERQRRQQAEASQAESQRADGWSAATSAALGDVQLAARSR